MGQLICEFVVPDLPPRPGTVHPMVLHREKQRWARDIGWQAQAMKRGDLIAREGERRRVEVEFHRPGRAMDTDNAFARLKVPLDVLSRAHGRKKIGVGVLWDDDPDHLDLPAPVCVRDPRRRTVIRVFRVS